MSADFIDALVEEIVGETMKDAGRFIKVHNVPAEKPGCFAVTLELDGVKFDQELRAAFKARGIEWPDQV